MQKKILSVVCCFNCLYYFYTIHNRKRNATANAIHYYIIQNAAKKS